MKKIFFLGAIAALALTACQKQDDPSGPSKNLVYDGPESVTIDEGTYFYSIKFTANADWKVMVDSEDSTAVTVDKAKGTAGEQTVKVSFEDLAAGQTGRLSIVAISTNGFANQSDDNNASVFFMQGKVFSLLTTEDEVGADGGTVTYKMIHNCEDVKCTHIDNDWATSQWNSETGEVILTAEANDDFDPRSASAVFTVADIKVDSVTSATFYAAINQSGNLKEEWRTEFDATIALKSTNTIALFGDKLYVANHLSPTNLIVYNSETGASEGTLDISGISDEAINSITRDDAGNLVMAFGKDYGCTFEIFRVKAGREINVANAEKLLSCTNNTYGYGFDHIKVCGDVTASASICVVTPLPADEPTDGTGYAACWQVTDGTVTDPASYAEITLPFAANIWFSGQLVAVPTSSDINGGMYYLGYDECYDIKYREASGAEWTTVFNPSVTGWGEDYCGMDIVDWNSGKYMVVDANVFYNEWGMPSYIYLLDINNPAEGVKLSCTEHYYNGGELIGDGNVYDVNERTADVCAIVEDGDLAVYIVDNGGSFVSKLVYPASCL